MQSDFIKENIDPIEALPRAPKPKYKLGQIVTHKLNKAKLIVLQSDYAAPQQKTIYLCRDKNFQLYDVNEFELM